jgi:hypothetical protein
MKKLLFLFCFISSTVLTAQVPVQATTPDKEIKSGFVVLIAADENLATVQEQYDIFENGRKYFAERNIQPYLVTPTKVESFFNEENERFLNFGDYKKLKADDSDFYILVLDSEYNTKFRSTRPITTKEISEVLY